MKVINRNSLENYFAKETSENDNSEKERTEK